MKKENTPKSRADRRELEKKQENNWKSKRKSKKKALKEKRASKPPFIRFLYALGRFLRRTVLALLITVSIIAIGAFAFYKKNYEELVSKSVREGYEIAQNISPDDFRIIEPSAMYYDDGSKIRSFTDRNFQYLDLQEDDELYERVSDVVTAIEDERFYKHEGFDYLGVGVAVFDHVVRGTDLRGASTITAQLVKNTYLSQEQNIERKVKEAVIAQELENVFTKREILEFYVNDAYFGNGNYGIETAANYYFSKPTKELSYREIASLVAIPNNPTIYNPVNNPENNIKRRNLILGLLETKEVLDKETVKKEKESDIALDITETKIDNNVKGWAESFAMTSAVEEMMRYNGFKFEYWHDDNDSRRAYKERYNESYQKTLQRILRGGFAIETSINKEMQNKLQSHIDKSLAGYTAKDKDGFLSKQAPSVVIDNRTNEVVAIVGGRTEDNMGLFNRASQSARQPGSAIKPFLSYAPAFEKGLATGTIRKDKAIKNGPGNWYSGHRGNMTLRKGLEQSVNTIAYNLYQEVGMEFAREKLVDMEFRNLAPEDIYPTMAIGGWTYGTNPLEIASAFNTLVNDGLYTRPNNLRRVGPMNSETSYYDRKEHLPKRVYKTGVGYVTLDVMQSTVANSFVKGYSFDYEFEAAKTGTTNDVKELWIVGGSPYYSMASYIGDNDPAPQNSSVTTGVLQKIFTGYMKDIHKGLKVIDFKKPQAVVQQGNNLWVRTKKDVNPQTARDKDEKERIDKLSQKQKDRVKSLAYRIKYGLSLNEAKAREKIAEAHVQKLEVYKLNGSKDLSEADELYKEAEGVIDEVVRIEPKQSLTNRLEQAYKGVIGQREAIIAEEERQIRLEKEREEEERRQEQREREEEERREQERIEREEERIEEERREEERLERERQEEEERLEQERLEEERLEEERLEEERREEERLEEERIEEERREAESYNN